VIGATKDYRHLGVAAAFLLAAQTVLGVAGGVLLGNMVGSLFGELCALRGSDSSHDHDSIGAISTPKTNSGGTGTPRSSREWNPTRWVLRNRSIKGIKTTSTKTGVLAFWLLFSKIGLAGYCNGAPTFEKTVLSWYFGLRRP